MRRLFHRGLLGLTWILGFGVSLPTALSQNLSIPIFPGVSSLRGKLLADGAALSGPLEVQLQLFDAADGGKAITTEPVSFTTTAAAGDFTSPLDVFKLAGGDNVSIRDCVRNAQNGFLQVSVKRPGESAFTSLVPRQSLGSLPLSLFAGNAVNAEHAAIAEGLTSRSLIPSALLLADGATPPLNGQVLSYRDGTFVWVPAPWGASPGTGDSLTLSLDPTSALRLTPGNRDIFPRGAPNLIAGVVQNSVPSGRGGNVIAGGGLYNTPNVIYGDQSFIGTGYGNSIADLNETSVIVSGAYNQIGLGSLRSFIGTGYNIQVGTNAPAVFIGAAYKANVGDNSGGSVIVGGANQKIAAYSSDAFLGGGDGNSIGTNSTYSVLVGGYLNSLGHQNVAATIAGGQYNEIVGADSQPSSLAFIGGGYENLISHSTSAVISGGNDNKIRDSYYSVIGGGTLNLIETNGSSVIGGGSNNSIGLNAAWGTISGGNQNVIHENSRWAVIPGGQYNQIGAQADGALAAGTGAHADHFGSFVWSDRSTPDSFATVSENEFAIRAHNGVRVVTGGAGLTVDGVKLVGQGGVLSTGIADHAVDATKLATASPPSQGQVLTYDVNQGSMIWRDPASASTGWSLTGNSALPAGAFLGSTDNSVVEFRAGNSVVLRLVPGANLGDYPNASFGDNQNQFKRAQASLIGGGVENTIESSAGSFIGAGSRNTLLADSTLSAIVAGSGNSMTNGSSSVIAAGFGHIVDSSIASGIFVGDYNAVFGAVDSFIGGGAANRIGGSGRPGQEYVYLDHVDERLGTTSPGGTYAAVIGGGHNNLAFGHGATVGGGVANLAGVTAVQDDPSRLPLSRDFYGAKAATVAGGEANRAYVSWTTIGGGSSNSISAISGTIAGGSHNGVFGVAATVGGGDGNLAIGPLSVVPGGTRNYASGRSSFAAGEGAIAVHNHSFVWSDGMGPTVSSSESNQVTIQATGGTRIITGRPADGSLVGVSVAPGSGSWSSMSDRHTKTHVEPVNPREVLARVAHLPLATWNYKSQDESVRHLGPMAQDFHEAFHLGEDERHISNVDADGVALAAIQGLNEELEAERAASRQKEVELRDLRERLAALEALVKQLGDRRTGGDR